MNKHPQISTDSFHIFTIWAAVDNVFVLFSSFSFSLFISLFRCPYPTPVPPV